jgi:hypothetical protein
MNINITMTSISKKIRFTIFRKSGLLLSWNNIFTLIVTFFEFLVSTVPNYVAQLVVAVTIKRLLI